jgi:hypothetical protein
MEKARNNQRLKKVGRFDKIVRKAVLSQQERIYEVVKTKATKALSKMDENSVTMLSKPTQSSERGNNMHEFYNKSGMRND